MNFVTSYQTVLSKIEDIDPEKYGRTRNYLDGAVTYLSPYISRGVISTRQILETVIKSGFQPYRIEKFIQELAWRDYWQQVALANKARMNDDLKQPQPAAQRVGLPLNLLNHQTGILAIDNAIQDFYNTGYLHNHVRMYIASMACNVAKCHWKIPAKWMYYHLLDADWASNALSWQWVSGANSNKLYYANQENINRYCYTHQQGSYLDVSYDAFEQMPIPDALQQVVVPDFTTCLPNVPEPEIDENLPTLIYNFYNLDPNWRNDLNANRILLLEPSVFKQFPISTKSLEFCLNLAKDNIPGI
ncbi:MAG: hypothetical protein RLY16_2856, partial [Bacteroidota bacterium]